MQVLKKRLKTLFSSDINIGFVVTLIVPIIFFSIFYILTISKLQALFVEQMYHRQKLAVTAGANSIEVFLKTAENSLVALSRNPSIVEVSESTQQVLNDFEKDWEDTAIAGAALVDKDGNLTHLSGDTYSPGELEKEHLVVSDREYFEWAKNAEKGEVAVLDVIIPRPKDLEPQYVIPMVTPIFKNDQFQGVLLVPISVHKLTASYLKPLAVSPNSRIYFINTQGTILTAIAGQASLVGVNYLEYLQDNPYPGSEKALNGFKKALTDSNGGRLDLNLINLDDDKLVRYLIVHEPVKYANKKWTLGLAVPTNDVQDDLLPFKGHGVGVVVGVFLIILLSLSAMSVLLDRINQEAN